MPTTMTYAELEQAADVDLGASAWREVTQQMIDLFAEATGDHQWIHVDHERAAAGPFGTTIAHGFLTLSLLPDLMAELVELPDVGMTVNYGVDRLRMTAPVPSGSRIRVVGKLLGAEPKAGGLLTRTDVTVEIEGGDRPALVATSLLLRFPA